MILIQVVPNKGAIVTGKFDARFYQITRDMPGKKKWHEGKLIFELTANNIEYFQKQFPLAIWQNINPNEKLSN